MPVIDSLKPVEKDLEWMFSLVKGGLRFIERAMKNAGETTLEAQVKTKKEEIEAIRVSTEE